MYIKIIGYPSFQLEFQVKGPMSKSQWKKKKKFSDVHKWKYVQYFCLLLSPRNPK